MIEGDIALVLHAHLPFVRHPEYPEFMEEDWLFEAMTETYLPLLRMMGGLADEGLQFQLTMTLSPTLCEMLADPLLQSRYQRHVTTLIALSEKEVERLAGGPLEPVARMYLQELTSRIELFEACHGNLLSRFKAFQDSGRLEIITCCATHGFLPLMLTDEAIRAQLVVAVRNYEKHFDCRPRGIWLAECAWRPGLEPFLADAGLRYFFVDTHGITHATPRPVFGTAAPILCPNGVAAFARDPISSAQVWSATHGYPAHPSYREFYRDLGWDAPMEYIRPYLHADGFRRNLGIKYHRITGKVPLEAKEPYDPAAALATADRHADDFLYHRQVQIQSLREGIGRSPLLVSPYDAELFGHWWFEGPVFLERFLRKTLLEQNVIRLVTPGQYLQDNPVQQEATPAASTWGRNGHADVWLNQQNQWIYPYLHHAERQMGALARAHRNAEGLTWRALNQAARELLLLQSSDWPFIITQNTTVPYAEKRIRDHFTRFSRLADALERDQIDVEDLESIEGRDNLFSELDYRVYAPQSG